MKILYLVRHSKAVSDDPFIKDINRPLTNEGIIRAEKMAEIILNQYPKPDYLITSHAVRARQTADIFTEYFQIQKQSVELDELAYRCHYLYLIDKISLVDNRYNCIMIIGHNPTISHAVTSYLKEEFDFLPPCGVVCLKFDTDSWEKVRIAKEFKFLDPRMR